MFLGITCTDQHLKINHILLFLLQDGYNIHGCAASQTNTHQFHWAKSLHTDIHPGGQSRASASVPCTFSQRQGYVAIQLADGTRHELSPSGDQPGTYVDGQGRPAYRNKGLGSRGRVVGISARA